MGVMNIGQEHIDGGPTFDLWRDTRVRREGEGAAVLQAVFLFGWYNGTSEDLFAADRFPSLEALWIRREDGLPIAFHVDDNPTIQRCSIKRLVELSHMRLAVVGIFPLRIGMMHHDTKPALAGLGRPLQHLEITIRVPEGRNRPAADLLVDADGLAGAIVDEVHLGQAKQHGFAVAALELGDDTGADDLLGRDAIALLGEGPDELGSATGRDVGLEPIGTQVGQDLQHGLVHELVVAAAEARVLGGREPLLDALPELLWRHAGMRHGDDLDGSLLAGGCERCHVAFEHRLERLRVLPDAAAPVP
jgi:hypothetical protein